MIVGESEEGKKGSEMRRKKKTEDNKIDFLAEVSSLET